MCTPLPLRVFREYLPIPYRRQTEGVKITEPIASSRLRTDTNAYWSFLGSGGRGIPLHDDTE